MGVIEIEGMEFYAYHGHFKEEQVVGNKFLIDIKVETDIAKAAKTDDLNDTLDYQKLYQLIKAEMSIVSNLLENVASRILDAVWNEFKELKSVNLKVSKINPPLGGKINKVSVSVNRDKASK